MSSKVAKTGLIFLTIFLLSGVITWYACFKKRSPNIIVILVDTLRADHLGIYGYERPTSPNLDSFAREAIIYERTISTSSWTAPAVSSIFTGLYPSQHTNHPVRNRRIAAKGQVKLPLELETLAERLKNNNYMTAAISSNPWISQEFAMDQGFDSFNFSDHARADKILGMAKKTISKLSQNKSQPFFLYVHILDPHSPYSPPGEYITKFNGNLKSSRYEKKWQDKINRYDGEIAFTDFHIGIFFDFLKKLNLFDDSVIIFVSDHGEAFNEHGTGGHGYNLYMEEVHVPLIVKIPGYQGRTSEVVSQIDIFPTILHLIGAKPDTSLPGLSLLDTKRLKKRSGIFSEVYRVFVQDAFSTPAGERLIMDFGRIGKRTTAAVKGMYDLNSDPLELRPIQDPAMETELKSYREALIQSNRPKTKENIIEINPQTLQKLETLGYINQ